jgi:hypothetical protein
LFELSAAVAVSGEEIESGEGIGVWRVPSHAPAAIATMSKRTLKIATTGFTLAAMSTARLATDVPWPITTWSYLALG